MLYLSTPKTVTYLIRLLTSKDKIVNMLAWEALSNTMNYRHQSARLQNRQDYLNSVPSARNSNKYKSPLSRARQASNHLKIKWEVGQDLHVVLCMGDEIIEYRNKIFYHIRKHLSGTIGNNRE